MLTLLAGAGLLVACGRIGFDYLPLGDSTSGGEPRATGAAGGHAGELGGSGTGGSGAVANTGGAPDGGALATGGLAGNTAGTAGTPAGAVAGSAGVSGGEAGAAGSSTAGAGAEAGAAGSSAAGAGGAPWHDWRTGVAFGLVEELSSASAPAFDTDPFLAQDNLTLYFVSDRAGGVGGTDVYVATRPSPTAPFGTPVLHASVNTVSSEGHFQVSRDGLTMLLTSDWSFPGLGLDDVWTASRATTAKPYGAWSALSNAATTEDERINSDLYYDCDQWLTDDGLELYFTSARPSGVGSQDIYVTTRPTPADPWGPATIVPAINTAEAEANATLSADKNTIVFTSCRLDGMGGCDLWYAVRSSPAESFGTPLPVPDVNTIDYEGEPCLSPDGRELLFVSSRSSAVWNLYHAVLQ